MNFIKLYLFVNLSVLIISGCCRKNQPQNISQENIWNKSYLDTADFDIVSSVNQFSFRIFTRLSNNDNLICSPLSVSSALAMTYCGAENNTLLQMADVLLFTHDKQQVSEGFSALINDLNNSSDKIKVSLANSLWAQEGFSFTPSFMENAKKYYQSGLRTVDFVKKPLESQKEINQWVNDKTSGKIKEIVSENDISPLTRLILANAVYFNAAWLFPFDENSTRISDFTLDDGSKTSVRMMGEFSGSYGYFENDSFQFLKAYYDGKVYSLNILLPQSKFRLQQLEKKFSNQYFNYLEKNCYDRRVDVFLPKFSFASSFSLKDILIQMGMRDAFNDSADFSGMTGSRDLLISNVLHKAFIEVNEKGTEAAAATVVIMTERAALPEEKPVFRADHPFFFYIKNNETGVIVFMGKVMNPKNIP